MATDRPTISFTPRTVGPGHAQIEAALSSYARDDAGTRETEQIGFGIGEIRIGLLRDLEFHVAGSVYRLELIEEAGATDERGEFGALTLRAKYTIFGAGGPDPGIKPILAALPFYDTAVGDQREQIGVLFPFFTPLPGRFTLVLQPGIGVVEPWDDPRALISGAVAVGHPVVIADLAAYVEFFFDVVPERAEDWLGAVNTGLTHQLTDSVQLNLAAIVGVTDPAPDLRLLVGGAVRF